MCELNLLVLAGLPACTHDCGCERGFRKVWMRMYVPVKLGSSYRQQIRDHFEILSHGDDVDVQLFLYENPSERWI